LAVLRPTPGSASSSARVRRHFAAVQLDQHAAGLDQVLGLAAVQADGLDVFQFASRLDNVETSAIRELFKLLGKPGIISFAGGFPDSAMFDVEGLREASQKALAEEPAARCSTAPPKATSRCARSSAPS
jgi:DNA-binding transcriptional MocR family regulator